jgi:hypothetical protein
MPGIVWLPAIAVLALALLGLVYLFRLVTSLVQSPVPARFQLPAHDLNANELCTVLTALGGAQQMVRVEAINHGVDFYEAELSEIRSANHSVVVEAFILEQGEIAVRSGTDNERRYP